MKMPKGFVDDPDNATGLGQNDSWFVGNRFIKHSTDPKTETMVGDAFRATKTPGAYRVGFKEHQGSTYTISEKLDGKALKDTTDHELEPHLKHAGNILLSELLGGVADRHDGNYVVGMGGIHSIDHEYGLQTELGGSPSQLYDRYLSITGQAPIADKAHLNRWIAHAPKLIKQLQDSAQQKIQKPTWPFYEDRSHEYIEHLKGTLTQAHELAKKHGHVPLKELISEHWHYALHGEPRGDMTVGSQPWDEEHNES